MKTFWECPRCMKLNFSRDMDCFVCRHVNPAHPDLTENRGDKNATEENKKDRSKSDREAFAGSENSGQAILWRKCFQIYGAGDNPATGPRVHANGN